jgi:hypothetical protein
VGCIWQVGFRGKTVRATRVRSLAFASCTPLGRRAARLPVGRAALNSGRHGRQGSYRIWRLLGRVPGTGVFAHFRGTAFILKTVVDFRRHRASPRTVWVFNCGALHPMGDKCHGYKHLWLKRKAYPAAFQPPFVGLSGRIAARARSIDARTQADLPVLIWLPLLRISFRARHRARITI